MITPPQLPKLRSGLSRHTTRGGMDWGGEA